MNGTNIVEQAGGAAREAMRDPGGLAETIMGLLVKYGLKVIGAIAIFLIGRLVARMVRDLVRKLMEKSKQDEALVSFVGSLLYAGLMAFVIIAAMQNLGIPTASLIAVMGAAGLAIGLALQGSLGNFAAGVLMIIFKPLRVGDFVEAAGITGKVEEVEVFTTVLRTPDNKKIIVPNGALMGGNIVNYSDAPTRRVDLVVGCGYGDDLDKVKQVLNDILAKDERVLKDPAPTVALSELADSSVNFVVRPWVKPADYWDVYFGVTEQVKRRFDDEGLSIPFPQQDVHLHQASK